MKRNTILILLVIAMGLMLLSTVLFPPRNVRETGSTFGKGPDGYGAWYASMEEQGFSLQRWQKGEYAFITAQKNTDRSTTLLRVFPQLTYPYFSDDLKEWIKKGNKLVLIGISAPATATPFRSQVKTDRGPVTIATTRRFATEPKNTITITKEEKDPQILLKDPAGTIVWQYKLGKGQVILATPADLAANAYQNAPGNFAFLTYLVGDGKMPVVIDEFLHGYVDKETLQQEQKLSDWQDYLAQTPLSILFIEGLVIIFVLIVTQNRRFGVPLNIDLPPVNNSFAYIEALAAVLDKANSYKFVVEKISRAEQIYLQQQLGLGSAPLPVNTLSSAWQKQTGRSAREITILLEESRSITTIERLVGWLEKVYQLRDHVNKNV